MPLMRYYHTNKTPPKGKNKSLAPVHLSISNQYRHIRHVRDESALSPAGYGTVPAGGCFRSCSGMTLPVLLQAAAAARQNKPSFMRRVGCIAS